jgi:type VI protein secretion system component VasK
VAIDCGGKTVTYAMGPPREESLSWPGDDPNADAGMRAQAAPPDDPKKKRKKGAPESIGIESISAGGPWAIFRLLDRAREVSTSGGATSATWSMSAVNGGKIQTTWVFNTGNSTSPFARGFLRISPPATP